MPSFSKLIPVFVFLLFSAVKSFPQVAFSSSNLPIIVINTNGQNIPDDPKITASMGIIWNVSGNRNSVNDTKNNYDGKIGIEIRGSSSQNFPKKSYGVETRSDDGQDLDVSLLGMPAESDWVLYGPYSDKSLIRNVLTFTIDGTLGHYSPRCRFAELVLNGNYQGVYVLMEKIKRNKKRVDVAKLETDENSGEDLTGGYIIKIDKTTGSGGDGWSSDYYNTYGKTYYQYEYPKQEVITWAQKSYIQNYVRNMETSLQLEKYTGTGSYHEYLNDSSCIDFMIMNELTKNIDGYRLSSYLYKDKNGLLNCGPIWDFNLGYGNANYYSGWLTYGLQVQADIGQDNWQVPFWWKKLMRDPDYQNKLKRRWTLLRKNQLSATRISFVTDSLVNLLSEAEVRNFQRWPVIGQYVWPNYYVGSSYYSEVSWMKSWISNRLAFLDLMWTTDDTQTTNPVGEAVAKVFPNPFADQITVTFPERNASGVLEIVNAAGSLVYSRVVDLADGQIRLSFSGNSVLSNGIYFLQIKLENTVLSRTKIVRSE